LSDAGINVVTGAFGYTGKYITPKLLSDGHQVRTITGHLDRANPFGDQVKAYPLDFGDPNSLAKNLSKATTSTTPIGSAFPAAAPPMTPPWKTPRHW